MINSRAFLINLMKKINNKNKGNYAFIDSQNLNLAIKELGWKLDFKKFRVYLKHKYNVQKAFLFIGYVVGNEMLYSQLQDFGYKIIFKPTLDKKGVVKGNCDAELVLHCMIELNNFQKAIIVSNDGDFHCLVEYLAEENKLLKLITPSQTYSSLLRKFAKHIVSVPLFRHKVEHKKRDIPAA